MGKGREPMLGWLRKHRRERLLREPFPEGWEAHLARNVRAYERLLPDERERLRNDLRVFIAEKYWEGCGGLKLTDEIRVTIAAQACLLTLNLPHDFYPNVRSIFVYPAGFRSVQRRTGPDGVVTEQK